MSDSLQPHRLQHTRLPCPSLSPSLLKLMFIELVMPSNHLILCCPFSCPQSFPTSGSFPMSQLFASGSQRLEFQLQHQSCQWIFRKYWFPLGVTGLISLQSRGLSSVFSSTTVWKHQFFGAQPSLWSTSHISTWLTEKNLDFDYMDLCWQNDVSTF